MSSTSVFNLIDMIHPFCLLEYKNIIKGLKPGDEITVLIQDTDVLESLKKIIYHSSDFLINVKKEEAHHVIRVRKN